jgi:hypothetical protein
MESKAALAQLWMMWAFQANQLLFLFNWDLVLVNAFSLPLLTKPSKFVLVLSADADYSGRVV